MDIREVIDRLKMVGPHATPVYAGVTARATQISGVAQVVKFPAGRDGPDEQAVSDAVSLRHAPVEPEDAVALGF
jgi:hypothetical protein